MAFALVFLGTDTVYSPNPEALVPIDCRAVDLPSSLEAGKLYIKHMDNQSIQYFLLDSKGMKQSNIVYSVAQHGWASNVQNALNFISWGLIPPQFNLPFNKFDWSQLENYLPFIADVEAWSKHIAPVCYPRGETLSLFASLIDEANVKVLNGPVMLGSNVGEIIAEGLVILLTKLFEGENTFIIPGHSRGAAEARIVSHEIQRVHDLLKDPDCHKTMSDILKESPCPLIKAAFQKLFETASESSRMDQIGVTIKRLLGEGLEPALHLLEIDPVPGDGDGYWALKSIDWKDSRLTQPLPKLVKSHLQILKENEHSRFFKPSTVEYLPGDRERVQLITLPGHHGTASGNPFDQNLGKSLDNPSGRKTYGVQNLMLCKLVDLASKHGIRLKDKNTVQRHELINLVYRFLESEEKPAILLEIYSEIQSNIEAYRHFNSTAYGGVLAPLLQHSSIHNFFSWFSMPLQRQGNRRVHKAELDRDTFMIEMLSGSSFRGVNREHVALRIAQLPEALRINPRDLDDSCLAFKSFIQAIKTAEGKLRSEILALHHSKVIEISPLALLNDLTSLMLDEYLSNALTPEGRAIVIKTFNQLLSSPVSGDTDWDRFIDTLKAMLKPKLVEAIQGKIHQFRETIDELQRQDPCPLIAFNRLKEDIPTSLSIVVLKRILGNETQLSVCCRSLIERVEQLVSGLEELASNGSAELKEETRESLALAYAMRDKLQELASRFASRGNELNKNIAALSSTSVILPIPSFARFVACLRRISASEEQSALFLNIFNVNALQNSDVPHYPEINAYIESMAQHWSQPALLVGDYQEWQKSIQIIQDIGSPFASNHGELPVHAIQWQQFIECLRQKISQHPMQPIQNAPPIVIHSPSDSDIYPRDDNSSDSGLPNVIVAPSGLDDGSPRDSNGSFPGLLSRNDRSSSSTSSLGDGIMGGDQFDLLSVINHEESLSDRKLLDQLANHCRAYLDYARQQLHCPKGISNQYTPIAIPYTDSVKIKILRVKHNQVLELYNLATTGSLKDFSSKFNEDGFQKSLQQHRDGLIIRLIKAICGVLCIIPQWCYDKISGQPMRAYSFWKPARSEQLTATIEEEMKRSLIPA
jgi:hypothetical protein